MFKSTDGASSWVELGPADIAISALAIDPQAPATLYVGSEFACTGGFRGPGVFKSTNGGATWISVNAGLTNTFVRALAIDPKTPTTVYAGTDGGGVFKSTDGGGSWSAINDGLTHLYITTLAIDPHTPVRLYAGTVEGGVFVMELE